MTDFIVLGSRITEDDDCNHEIKRRLLLVRKAITNLDRILKRRDITWLTKVWIVQALVFPSVMYEYEGWTIKKAESQRIDAFEMWCWRRLESSLDSKWIKSVLKEFNPTYFLEGLMLKLKVQNFDQLM